MTSKTQKPVKKPASEFEKLAKAITRDARVRAIDIRYVPDSKKWFAWAVPESFIVHRRATEELKALQRNTSMEELSSIYVKHEKTPLARGEATSPEEALLGLRDALQKLEDD